MSKLTTFSKIIIVTAFLGFILLLGMTCQACLSGCNSPNQQGYYPQPQQPTVMYVQQPDGTSFMMNYLMYQALMNQGGQGAVNNYYIQHKNEPEFQPEQQQYYQKKYEVETQKSKGFGTVEQPKQQVNTSKSSGFGSYTPSSSSTNTQKSSGFGRSTQQQSTQTSKSSGFGSSSYKTTTQKSSGFGSSSKSTSTSKSSGFGKKNK